MSTENEVRTDCSTNDGITVGLIDSIINAGHVLKGRNLTSTAVFEAISDLRSQPLLRDLFLQPQTEWRVVYRERTGRKLAGKRLFKVESEARDFIAGRKVGGVSLMYTWQGINKEVGLQKRDFGVSGPWRVVDFDSPKYSELTPVDADSDLYRFDFTKGVSIEQKLRRSSTPQAFSRLLPSAPHIRRL